MVKKYLDLKDVVPYTIAYPLSNYVWRIVIEWNYFARDTVGRQFVRVIDSISANIAEGFGRYTKKDKIRFYRYAFGSFREALDWVSKARDRDLLTKEQADHIQNQLNKLPREIYHLINLTNEKLSK